jgi:hypothetical protein
VLFGMSNTDQLGALEYEAESATTAWAENVDTYATHRIAILDPIIPALTQDGIPAEHVVQQMQGGTTPIVGFKDGTFKTKTWLHGHGTTTSGATTLDAMETWLGYAFGNPSASTGVLVSASAGTTVNGAGSTTTNIVTTASGTFARGSLFRLGTGGTSADGRGSGQFYAVNTHTTTNLVPRTATITAASNADVVYSGVNFWFPELVSSSAVKGLRYRSLSANQQYRMHGCYATGWTISGSNAGEVPSIEVDWGVTWWDPTSSGTFPSTVTQNAYNPAPIGGGSMVIADVGSTTRTAYDVAAFSVSCEMGMVPLPGHSTVDPRSRYVGARRAPSKIRADITIYAEAAGTNTFSTKFRAGTSIQWTWSGSVTAGSALGMHAQNFKIDKDPVQGSTNGINTITISGYCCAGTADVTTDLAQAAFVIGYA